MKISIAMATYNGAKYIQEQLDSFACQTRFPDELIICDDCSSDDTVRICHEFAEKAPFVVRIFENLYNLGVLKNFENALSKCTGELIFFSDQDDVWFKNKVERVEIEFKKFDKIKFISNDTLFTDKNLKPTGITKLDQIKRRGLKHSGVMLTGCCTAIKKDMVSLINPIPEEFNAHDVWIHRLASKLDVSRGISDVLQYYRRHGDNYSNGLTKINRKINVVDTIFYHTRKTPDDSFDLRISKAKALKKRILSKVVEVRTISGKDYLYIVKEIDDEIASILERKSIRQKRMIPRWINAFSFALSGKYSYFQGYLSFFRDLMFK